MVSFTQKHKYLFFFESFSSLDEDEEESELWFPTDLLLKQTNSSCKNITCFHSYVLIQIYLSNKHVLYTH